MTDTTPAPTEVIPPTPTPPGDEQFFVWDLISQVSDHPFEGTERMCIPEGWIYRVTHGANDGSAALALVFVPSDFHAYVPAPEMTRHE